MVVHSYKDPLICLTFPSSLKGVASDLFYSMSLHSLHSFMEIIEAFLTQYASREAEKNNRHLLSVKIREGDSLGNFQSQLAKVSNCDENVFALMFISRLQISYPLYKHLLNHDITQISEVMSQA